MKLRWLQRAFLVLIAAASLYASLQNLIDTLQLGSISEDPVAKWDGRFVGLKAQLPFVRGAVGYISDSDVPGAVFDAPNDEGEYILTQYAMAPIILVRGTDLEWNIANLSRESLALWSARNAADFDITPFQGGIYLLHRTGS